MRRLRRSLWVLAALAAAASVASCTRRPPEVLPEGKMVDILTDLELTAAYQNTVGPSPGKPDRNAMTEAVLEKHGVSREELDSTIAYYGRNIDEYYLLYEKVEKNLRKKSGQMVQEVGDDADIWPYSPFAAFLPGQMGDGINFSIPLADIEPGSMLEWRLHTSSANGVEMTLGVEYEGGISSFLRRNAAGNTSPKVTLITDTAMTPKRVFGVMSVPERELPLWVDSIRLVTLPYDSMEYRRITYQKTVRPLRPKPAATNKDNDKDSVEKVKGTVVTEAVERH